MVQSTPLPTNLPEPYRPVKTIRERIDEASTAQKVAFCIGVAIVGAFIILFFVFERQIFECMFSLWFLSLLLSRRMSWISIQGWHSLSILISNIVLEPAVSFIRKSDAGIAVLSSIMAATCIFPLLGVFLFVILRQWFGHPSRYLQYERPNANTGLHFLLIRIRRCVHDLWIHLWHSKRVRELNLAWGSRTIDTNPYSIVANLTSGQLLFVDSCQRS